MAYRSTRVSAALACWGWPKSIALVGRKLCIQQLRPYPSLEARSLSASVCASRTFRMSSCAVRWRFSHQSVDQALTRGPAKPLEHHLTESITGQGRVRFSR